MSQGSLGRNVRYCGLGGHDKETWPTGESGTNLPTLPTLPSIGFIIWAKKRCGGHGVGTWQVTLYLMGEL